MGRKQQTRKKNNKRDTLKDLRIVLNDIATNIDLIPIHQRHLLKKKEEAEQLSYSNKSENSCTNLHLLQKGMQEIYATQSKISKVTKSFQNAAQGKAKKKCANNEFQLHNKEIERNEDISDINNKDNCEDNENETFQAEFLMQREILIINNNVETNSRRVTLYNRTCNITRKFVNNTSLQSEETQANTKPLVPSDFRHCSHVPKIITNRSHASNLITKTKNKLNSDKDINPSTLNGTVGSSDQKDSTLIDCNNKMQLALNKSNTSVRYDQNLNVINIANKANRQLSWQKFKKSHKKKVASSNVNNIHVKNKISIEEAPKAIKTGMRAEKFLVVRNNQMNQHDEDQLNAKIKQNREPISLTIDTAKLTSKFDTHIKDDFIIQSSINCVINNAVKSIDISPIRKDNHISVETNKLRNIPKISNDMLILKNSINLGNGKCYNEIMDHKKSNSLTRLTDPMNVSAACDTNVSLTSDKEVIQQNKKHVRQESQDYHANCKKLKLDRTTWLQNNVTTITLETPQYNISSIETNAGLELNSMNKDEQCNHKAIIDLREHLIRRRLKSLKTEGTTEDKNMDCILSNEVMSNDKNETIVASIAQNEEACKDISVDKRTIENQLPISNTTLLKEGDDTRLNLSESNNDCSHSSNNLQNATKEMQYTDKIDLNNQENINIQNNYLSDITNSIQDDDCISLFTDELSDIGQYEDTVYDDKKGTCKSLHYDVPYMMNNDSFDEYLTHNTNEFNKEYPQYAENSVQKLHKFEKAEKVSNNQQQQQVSLTNWKPTMKRLSNEETARFKKMFRGYCYAVMKRKVCCKKLCRYGHHLRKLIDVVHFETSDTICNIINYALKQSYNYLCQKIYIASLTKLHVDQILSIYKMFYDKCKLKKEIIKSVIKDFLSREMSLKMIVERLMACIMLNSEENFHVYLEQLLSCTEIYIKPSEYWDTVKNLVLKLQPNKNIIERILRKCINTKKPDSIQDINNSLINKLHPAVISTLDGHLLLCFKNLLTETTVSNYYSTVSTENSKQNLVTVETIASPDPQQSATNLSSPGYDVNWLDTNEDEKHVQEVNLISNKPYIMQTIDDLPEARSIYRDSFWKFYVDLDRFKKGLEYRDYDYVIDILQNYAEKQNENVFVRTCYNRLRREIKRSNCHLTNIIYLTGNKYFKYNLNI